MDSNVFISLFEREIGRNTRGLFVEAEVFFERVRDLGDVIVLSDWFFEEVKSKRYHLKDEIIAYFEKIGVKTEIASSGGQIGVREHIEMGIHSADALHIAIAIKDKCDCIVTFNSRDFKKAEGQIKILEPQDF
ncbi:MAG: PIN domain-containing protein [archaeon]|nr:PIN domain-containing protein [archaeon]